MFKKVKTTGTALSHLTIDIEWEYQLWIHFGGMADSIIEMRFRKSSFESPNRGTSIK